MKLVDVATSLEDKYDIAGFGYIGDRMVIWIHRPMHHPLRIPHFSTADCWCAPQVVFYDEPNGEPCDVILEEEGKH